MIIINGRSPSAQVLRDIIQDTPELQAGRDLIINWGARVIAEISENTRVINNYVQLNGLEQLQKFQDNNINCPEFCVDVEDAKINVRSGCKVWGRKLNHTQGYDIIGSGYRAAKVTVPTYRGWTTPRAEHFNSQWLQRDYWVEVIPQDLIVNEWRIHVFMGRIIGRGLKVQTEPSWRKLLVRSRNNGWTMIHTEEPAAIVKNAACSAVKAVGYDFGAVDILQTSIGAVVLEVNSAPALRSDYTLAAYTKAISRCAENKWNKWREKIFTDGEPD